MSHNLKRFERYPMKSYLLMSPNSCQKYFQYGTRTNKQDKWSIDSIFFSLKLLVIFCSFILFYTTKLSNLLYFLVQLCSIFYIASIFLQRNISKSQHRKQRSIKKKNCIHFCTCMRTLNVMFIVIFAYKCDTAEEKEKLLSWIVGGLLLFYYWDLQL